jgi:DNA-binding IclR family transcriptional regulator
MNELEEFIGTSAGKVWTALNAEGDLTLSQLKRETKLKEFELHAALGWLAREGKISWDKTTNTYSLR